MGNWEGLLERYVMYKLYVHWCKWCSMCKVMCFQWFSMHVYLYIICHHRITHAYTSDNTQVHMAMWFQLPAGTNLRLALQMVNCRHGNLSIPEFRWWLMVDVYCHHSHYSWHFHFCFYHSHCHCHHQSESIIIIIIIIFNIIVNIIVIVIVIIIVIVVITPVIMYH